MSACPRPFKPATSCRQTFTPTARLACRDAPAVEERKWRKLGWLQQSLSGRRDKLIVNGDFPDSRMSQTARLPPSQALLLVLPSPCWESDYKDVVPYLWLSLSPPRPGAPPQWLAPSPHQSASYFCQPPFPGLTSIISNEGNCNASRTTCPCLSPLGTFMTRCCWPNVPRCGLASRSPSPGRHLRLKCLLQPFNPATKTMERDHFLHILWWRDLFKGSQTTETCCASVGYTFGAAHSWRVPLSSR